MADWIEQVWPGIHTDTLGVHGKLRARFRAGVKEAGLLGGGGRAIFKLAMLSGAGRLARGGRHHARHSLSGCIALRRTRSRAAHHASISSA
jgi:hypothetical protein